MLGANPCRSEFNVEEGVPVTPAQTGDTEIEWRFEDRTAKRMKLVDRSPFVYILEVATQL